MLGRRFPTVSNIYEDDTRRWLASRLALLSKNTWTSLILGGLLKAHSLEMIPANSQAARDRFWNLRLDCHARILHFGMQHSSEGMNESYGAAV